MNVLRRNRVEGPLSALTFNRRITKASYQKKCALFIDADNMGKYFSIKDCSLRNHVERRLSPYRIVLQKAFGNYHNINKVKKTFSGTFTRSIDADSSLIKSAKQEAKEDDTEVFAIVSSDSDFVPLVEFLHKRGKKVLVFASHPSSKLRAAKGKGNCDVFKC